MELNELLRAAAARLEGAGGWRARARRQRRKGRLAAARRDYGPLWRLLGFLECCPEAAATLAPAGAPAPAPNGAAALAADAGQALPWAGAPAGAYPGGPTEGPPGQAVEVWAYGASHRAEIYEAEGPLLRVRLLDMAAENGRPPTADLNLECVAPADRERAAQLAAALKARRGGVEFAGPDAGPA